MPSDQFTDPEPARPFVTINAAQLRLSCDCGRELLITAASSTIRCECGRSWQLQSSATLVAPRAAHPNEDPKPT